MILVAIVTIVIIFLALGTAASYFISRDNINQIQEEALQIHSERVKEDIKVQVTHINDDTKDVTLSITNDWNDSTTINKLIVKCDDNRVLEEDFDVIINTAQSKKDSMIGGTNDGSTINVEEFYRKMIELRERC